MGEAVLSVTSAQLMSWVSLFLFPFVRIAALISTAPILGDPVVPRSLKVGLAALLALVIAPPLSPEVVIVPIFSAAGALLIAQQVLIGVGMGFAMKMVFTMVQAAGEYISLQMGLSFASFFDPASGGSTVVVSRLLHMVSLLIFLALDGHLLLIATLAHSFDTLPISADPMAARGWLFLAVAGAEIFASGTLLAMPLVTALLILNLAMGILNRASPQFSIFAIGFPLSLLAGIVLLQLLMPQLGGFLQPRFASGIDAIYQFVRLLRP